MITDINSEDRLVQQTFAAHLEKAGDQGRTSATAQEHLTIVWNRRRAMA